VEENQIKHSLVVNKTRFQKNQTSLSVCESTQNDWFVTKMQLLTTDKVLRFSHAKLSTVKACLSFLLIRTIPATNYFCLVFERLKPFIAVKLL